MRTFYGVEVPDWFIPQRKPSRFANDDSIPQKQMREYKSFSLRAEESSTLLDVVSRAMELHDCPLSRIEIGIVGDQDVEQFIEVSYFELHDNPNYERDLKEFEEERERERELIGR